MTSHILRDRSYSFAIEIVKMGRLLFNEKREYVISKQLLKSGTAIGALIREAEFAESRADYCHKFSIALKECNETLYWLMLLRDTGIISVVDSLTVINECTQLKFMLSSSVKKLRKGSKLA